MHPLHWSLALLLAISLTACSSLLTFTPEQAVVQKLINRENQNQRVVPETIRVLQTQPWQDGSVVLVKYQVVYDDGEKHDCLQLWTVRLASLSWAINNVNTMFMPEGSFETQVISEMSSEGFMMGLVSAKEAVSVEIEWDGGEIQSVEIVNGSFLAMRENSDLACSVRALDADGNILETERTGNC